MNINHSSPSPNFNERKDGQAPSLIILHYTGRPTGAEALAWLCDPVKEVSAHYCVEEKGEIFQLVAEEKRAWHAGVSFWAGETDINSASIGIELVNPGHEFGMPPYPKAQTKALIALCQDIMTRHNISAVLGHSDIAVTRKVDPGHLFPWVELAENAIGWQAEPSDTDVRAAGIIALNQELCSDFLCQLGYDPDVPYEERVIAFHRHFAPEKFNAWEDRPDKMDSRSVAKLMALLKLSKE